MNDERETTAALIAFHEMVLHDLDQAIGRASNDLMQLVNEFDSLSLTGGLLAHMERAVQFMEDECTPTEEDPIRLIELMRVNEMKRKLELLSHTVETRKDALERCE